MNSTFELPEMYLRLLYYYKPTRYKVQCFQVSYYYCHIFLFAYFFCNPKQLASKSFPKFYQIEKESWSPDRKKFAQRRDKSIFETDSSKNWNYACNFIVTRGTSTRDVSISSTRGISAKLIRYRINRRDILSPQVGWPNANDSTDDTLMFTGLKAYSWLGHFPGKGWGKLELEQMSTNQVDTRRSNKR